MRENIYHTTITYLKTWTDGLISFRINRPENYNFIPGQFSRLGLVKAQKDNYSEDDIIWRPYSIVSSTYDEELEYYSIVVEQGEFTQTLIKMSVGDEVLLDSNSYGLLTTDKFSGGKDLWLISTGTGLAPFISILYDLEIWERYEKIILVHSTKFNNELTYQDTIKSFSEHEYYKELVKDKLEYIKIVTREQSGADLYGRIPALIKDGSLESCAKTLFSQKDSRVMICGNPDMVKEVRNLLVQEKHFTVSRKDALGNIVTENGY
jgi:ferredoxin--NADP+ reductase